MKPACFGCGEVVPRPDERPVCGRLKRRGKCEAARGRRIRRLGRIDLVHGAAGDPAAKDAVDVANAQGEGSGVALPVSALEG